MMVSQVRDGILSAGCGVVVSGVAEHRAALGFSRGGFAAGAGGLGGSTGGGRVSPQRTKAGVEQRVLVIRRQLRTKSDLGEYGPEAIHRELQQRGERVVPAVATLVRI